MATITAFDAKTRFGELLDRVATGEEIVITRHDKPVARIVPENRNSLADVQDAVNGLNELRQQIAARKRSGRKLTDQDVRSALEEGRK
ncbi:MAG TPA: type II toxin-antitoxin system prevent-host-death family antitoxin [Verrucomicrobiae bacterium]